MTATPIPGAADDALTAAAATTAPLTRAEKKALKAADPEHVPFGTNLAWNVRGLSMAANVLLLGYFSIYATDALGMSPALLGSLMLASKVFDGFTDLIAGWLIDRTHTRFGRARPYELMLIGLWVTTWALFSTPEMSMTGKAAWVFVCYSLINSVFATFANINQTLYTALAFPSRVAMGKVAAFGGVLISFGAIVIAIVVPIALAWAGKDGGRWSLFALAFGAVFLLMGLSRFIFVKETVTQAADTTEKVTVREIIAMLKDNRYIWMILIIGVVAAIAGNTGASAYYFTYIVGNLGMQSVTAGVAIVIVPTIMLVPWLMKRFRLTRIIVVGQLLVVAAGIVNYIANGNLVLLVIATLISGLGTLPGTYMQGILVIDCSTYNEWKGHRRLESIMGAFTSFAAKIGAGISLWLAGQILAGAGYDGTLETQSASASSAITILFAVFPAVGALIAAGLYWFLDLDARLPQINADLAERRGQTDEEAEETETAPTVAEPVTEAGGDPYPGTEA
ncbi:MULTISPECIES: MFS transporter [unclassified Actinomyces]|uniref:MFS transporter n=1 Tax=unclassified Actinomyces TaxID=2609248 RepID=UPI002017E1B1|nr:MULTISPECIES: MFS transporter [unclassified Actinomyces]MCL3777408.1 MFS transporter [Actinomyces sp. AC-20-1]MCL3789070.1 MFS transporter [Actinomyces sp. 187325]MCL3792799.1 MFS transporter [Actinomyces sp. 186855]MCL3793871.1 MFS transporter [Actinomyces sp. 217892]